jgi:hypothetical protein
MINLDDSLEVEYGHILSDVSGRYVLLQAVSGSHDYQTCLVYDRELKVALIEERDELAVLLVTRLHQNGVQMYAEVPD